MAEVRDFGYMWFAKSRGLGDGVVLPQKVINMPECAHYLVDVKVPGPSAERAAPTAGCLSRGPSTRDALKGSVGRGCNDEGPVVRVEHDVDKKVRGRLAAVH